MRLSDDSVRTIIDTSGGYPYFLQFICREVCDAFIQRIDKGERASVPVATAIEHGLTVVTRNVRHFEPTGVPILDPSDSGPRKAG